MGEIADMMLDGTLCEGCGEYLGDGEAGFPRRCASCQIDHTSIPSYTPPRNPNKVACPTCGKHVKAVGLPDHMRDRHGSDVEIVFETLSD